MSGSKWVITPLWLAGSWRSFLYSSSAYPCHLFLVSSAYVRSTFLFFIVPIFAWDVPLVSLIFLKKSEHKRQWYETSIRLLTSAVPKEWRYPLCLATDVEHSFPNSSHVFSALCLCHTSIRRHPILFPFRSVKASWLALTNQKQQQWHRASFRAGLEKIMSQWQQAHIAPRFLFLKTITTESNHSMVNFRSRQGRYQFFSGPFYIAWNQGCTPRKSMLKGDKKKLERTSTNQINNNLSIKKKNDHDCKIFLKIYVSIEILQKKKKEKERKGKPHFPPLEVTFYYLKVLIRTFQLRGKN